MGNLTKVISLKELDPENAEVSYSRTASSTIFRNYEAFCDMGSRVLSGLDLQSGAQKPDKLC